MVCVCCVGYSVRMVGTCHWDNMCHIELCKYYIKLLEYEHGIIIFVVVDTKGLRRVSFTDPTF